MNELDRLQELDDSIVFVLHPEALKVQKYLLTLEGRSFDSFETNQQVARKIQDIVSRLGLAFQCQKPGCGQPAKLRCRKVTRSQNGVFQFDHVIDGRQTNHGGHPILPKLVLTEKAPDKRRKTFEDE